MTKKKSKITKKEKIKLLQLLKQKKIRECRKSLWEYLKTTYIDIKTPTGVPLFDDSHEYLYDFVNRLQDFLEGNLKNENGEEYMFFCVSFPPRFGKSTGMQGATEWFLGNNPDKRVGFVSYSQELVNKFSRTIRDKLKEEASKDSINLKNVFPHLILSKNNKSVKRWSLEDKQQTVNTTSLRGAATGFGYDLMIIDDPIKGQEEALNEKRMDDVWDFLNGNFISRAEGQTLKFIIIQTRWGDSDPVGRLLKIDKLRDYVYKIEYEALLNEEEVKEGKEPKMLCEDILSYKIYEIKKAITNDVIFYANYHQRLIMAELTLYNKLRFWSELPKDEQGKIYQYKKIGVLDPAADGKDYTAMISGYYFKNLNEVRVDNILYTPDLITKIEGDLVDFVIENDIDELLVESNGAFVILKNNIEKELKNRGYKCNIKKITQTKNKKARILSAANAVQETVFFNKNLEDCDAIKHIKGFRSNFDDNKHDDIEDALTLLYENYCMKNIKSTMKSFSNRVVI